MKVSLVSLVTAFIIGVAIGILYRHASLIVLVLLGIILFEMVLFIFSKIKEIKTHYLLFIIFISFACTLGILRGILYIEPELSNELKVGKQTFTAEIISIPEQKENSQTFDITLTNLDKTKLRITLPLYPMYTVGDVVKISGVIKEPEVILPIEIDSGKEVKSFDYKRYLHTKEIVGSMVYPSIEKIEEKQDSLLYKLYSLKQKSLDVINKKIPTPENALAAGVLLGTDTLPNENKEAIRVASLSHITVLSGFNVAIIVAAVLFLLRFLPFYLKICISGILVTLFVLMTGGGASLIRATLMAYVGLLALVLGRKYDALTSLFFALLVYVCITPEAVLYDVSLQLSFLATLGIILLYDDVYSLLTKYVHYKSVLAILATTIAVMIYTSPFLLYTFGTFSLYGILANVIALPLVPLLMASTFVLIITSFIPLVSHLFAFISYILSTLILFISKIISLLPFATLSITISSITMFIIYGIILGVTLYIHYKKSIRTIRVSDEDPTLVTF